MLFARTAVRLRHSPKAPTGQLPVFANRDFAQEEYLQQNFGVRDFSLIDRKKMTFQSLVVASVNAAYKPKDHDAKVYGGDNSTHKNHLRNEMKNMDKRIQPIFHDDLARNTLKTIDELQGPGGKKVSAAYLTGRLVGLLFFSESDRSVRFMNALESFHKAHHPDFIVVCVSLGSREMMNVSHERGFFHCLHRHGATWVTRDAGIVVNPFVPLPRMIIVDGTTGKEISRSGVTAVLSNPEGCMEAWAKGHSGVKSWADYRYNLTA